MKIKANGFEILSGVNGTKLLLTVAKESVGNLIMANNDKALSGDLAVEIKKWTKKRSLNANAYFHLLVNKIARVLNVSDDEVKIRLNIQYGSVAVDSNGNEVIIKLPKSVDITEFYDYAKWIADKQEKVETSYYLLYKNTHKLDSKEMAQLIEGTISEAKELGIETITIEEKARMMALWGSK